MPQDGESQQRPLGRHWSILLWFCALGTLYLASRYSYLLFHSLAELFSIVVACGIFMVAWNARRFLHNNYLLLLGVAYLFVAALDLLHMLAYSGMGVLPGYGTNLPTQLWIGARYLESVSLVVAPIFLGRRLNVRAAVLAYSLLVAAFLASVFLWPVFPVCYAGGGLTPFKVVSEYAICAVLLGAGALLYVHRAAFERSVFWMVEASIGLTIGSELLFTLYRSPYGPPNLAGHMLKIISFFLIYKAVIETGLVRPYGLLFRELKLNEEALRQARNGLQVRVRERTAELEDEVAVRQQAETRLRRANDLLESAFSNIHILIASMDTEFNYLKVNQAFAEAHGLDADAMVGRNHFDLHPEAATAEVFRRVRRTGQPHFALEEAMQSLGHAEKEGGYWDWSLQTVEGPDGHTAGLLLCLIDATARKTAQEELRRSEERFRLLAENAQDIVFRCRTRPALSLDYISPATGAILGYEPEEIYAEPGMLTRIAHPADQEALEQRLTHPEEATCPFVVRWRRKDGSTVWTEQTVVPVRDHYGVTVAVEGIARDITERKKDERRILAYQQQLRSLASELLLAEERERRRLAADLHDGVCQALAAAKIKIGILGKSSSTPLSQAALQEVADLVEQSIRDTRSLTFEISPPVLYEIGLEAALEWLAGQIEARYGIRTEVANDGRTVAVEEDVRVVLFRAVRELLINVAKHAGAERAVVSLRHGEESLSIAVDDDGRGFEVSELGRSIRTEGFGLFNIRERLEHMGGVVEIESQPGRGTRVVLNAPLKTLAGKGEVAHGDTSSAG